MNLSSYPGQLNENKTFEFNWKSKLKINSSSLQRIYIKNDNNNDDDEDDDDDKNNVILT